jgi:catechol-2,3-dioxygenase
MLYHVAFNVPRNKLPEAKRWLAQRATLLWKDGWDEFGFPSWDARAIYVHDPAGNLVELIARQALANEASTPFGTDSLLCISEVGFPVADVATSVAMLTSSLEVEPYDGQSAEFAPLGDEQGLLIVVKEGRPWFPSGIPAGTWPLTVTLRTPNARYHRIEWTAGGLAILTGGARAKHTHASGGDVVVDGQTAQRRSAGR